MSNLFVVRQRGAKRPPFCRILALILFLTWQSPAQTTNITTPSLASLQAAVAAGGSILLSFNGAIIVTNTLVISNNTTIYATSTNSATISGGNSNRIFQVASNVSLILNGLILSGGNSIGTNGTNGANGTTGNGGANGSAGNSGINGGNGLGGAIYNQGSTFAFTCVFLTNTATGGKGGNGGNGGGGSFSGGNGGNGGLGGVAYGGAIYNLGSLVLSNCSFAGNGALGGAGGTGGTNGTNGLTFPGSGGNGGVAAGAGLYNLGIATVMSSTFDFNFSIGGNSQAAGPPDSSGNGTGGPAGALAQGGGIYNAGINTLINCTFYQNLSEGGAGGNGGNSRPSAFNGGNGGNGGSAYGGSLYNDTAGSVAVTNCTFASGEGIGGTNGVGGTGSFKAGSAGSAGQVLGANVGNAGTFKLKNSILAYPTNGLNASGTITDLGFNISSDATPTLTPTNSHNNLDPLLGSFTTNGGPTFTLALLTNSPAIDGIYDASAPAYDQRNVPRPIGPRSDIGAVEFGTIPYGVSGQILFSSGNNPVSGATVTFVGGTTLSVQTDANGNYTITNVPPGTYTVTPQLTNITFTPTNLTITLPPSTNNLNFMAAPVNFSISGQVTIGTTTNVYPNLTIRANGSNVFNASTSSFTATNSVTTLTDANGNYAFTNLSAGTYTVVPQATAGVAFGSTNLTTVTLPPGTNVNFTAGLANYQIDVQVAIGANAFSNAVVTVIGTTAIGGSYSNTTQTDINGHRIFNNLLAGNYVITPKPVAGASFNPSSTSLALSSNTNVLFSATVTNNYEIFGKITLGTNGSKPYLHVQVVASGTNAFNSTSSYSTLTGSTGIYLLSNLPAGTYVITPQPAGLFLPASVTITLPPSPSGSTDFVGLTATNSSLSIAYDAGASFVEISFATWVPNLTYRLQASSDLMNWQDIKSVTLGSNTVTYPISTNGFPMRYFRAVTP